MFLFEYHEPFTSGQPMVMGQSLTNTPRVNLTSQLLVSPRRLEELREASADHAATSAAFGGAGVRRSRGQENVGCSPRVYWPTAMHLYEHIRLVVLNSLIIFPCINSHGWLVAYFLLGLYGVITTNQYTYIYIYIMYIYVCDCACILLHLIRSLGRCKQLCAYTPILLLIRILVSERSTNVTGHR